MINNEWANFFGIEDVYDDSEGGTELFSGAKKDAAAALASCINTIGRVDIQWIMDASGLSLNELLTALEGAVFQDPLLYDRTHSETEGWVLRNKYLSGNLRDRLADAEKMNRRYRGRFDNNIRVLKEAMPEKVDFNVIGFGIGSTWIPDRYYALFAKETLGLYCMPDVQYSAALGMWKVSIDPIAANTVHNKCTYGTERTPALKILQCTLNGGNVRIYDDVERPNRKSGTAKVLNKAETLAAQEKQELLQKAFQTWVRKDPLRVRHLEKVFYDTFACNVGSRYSGNFLTLPGLNAEAFTPYPHQKDAVARIILDKDVLLNHTVGSGKTGIIIMGIHERFRMGLSGRNLIVVPNNVLGAFESAHHLLYPQDEILVVHPEDYRPDSRQFFLEKIRSEEFTAVYMPFSSFERLGMSRGFKLEKKRAEIRNLRAEAVNSSDKWEQRRLEAKANRLQADYEKMREELPADEYTSLDELGITTLVVDEAHNFKNISLNTSADGVVGLHAKGSAKCDDLMEKVQFVREQGGGVIFSTGTPLTNSIADLFVLQSYLQPEQLKLLRLDHFDEWINNFASRQTGFEVDVDSQNFRIRTRFSSFHNMPELVNLFANVCDFYSNGDSALNLPESGDYVDVVVEKLPEQKDYIDELVLRTEMIRQKLVPPTEDNLLKVTHDGRAAALDIRLVDPTASPNLEGTKIYACARNVYRLWQEHPGTAQLIFSDMGTPRKGFNVYDEMKRVLTEIGIPASEIAFVHDAATDARKKRLFAQVNKAAVRVLIGSSAKLGTGVNVQERLIAIHHLDIPWKPAEITQREGRLIRQGNENRKVFRFRYITAGTFDAYSWQILENKQRFISQFMGCETASRDVRDIDDTVLSYAEIKALCVGDPLLKERIDTSNELERLRMHERRRGEELRRCRQIAKNLPDVLGNLKGRKSRLEQDHRHYRENRESLALEDRNAFGEEVLEALRENAYAGAERHFDDVHGFRILLPAQMNPDRPGLLAEGPSGNRYSVDMRDAKPGGCVRRIENVLADLEARARKTAEEIKRAKKQAEQAEAELKKGNPYTKEAAEKSRKLVDIDEELNRRANEDAA